MKTLLLFALISAATLHAQNQGLWEGYDGEWGHASRQLIALAQATPPQKFSWRPAPGVRSIGEVYMHTVDGMYLRIIVHANEHMGQSIAYARMNGIVPPWSKPAP